MIKDILNVVIFTVENLANLFDGEKSTNLSCLVDGGHTTQPSADEDAEDDILNITSPQAIVPVLDELKLSMTVKPLTCNMARWKQH